MRVARFRWLVAAAALIPVWARAADVSASVPIERSVTIYRAPQASFATQDPSGALDVDSLGGFALVSETRTIDLPAGESHLRFEGVADGIEPASALISGLPLDILEKNQDAQVLSPAALVAASLGHDVVLVRTHPKTGQVTRTAGVIRSDAQGGVVFQSAEGIEALRCSGMPETLSFSAATDLGASPTLSALVRSPKAISAKVTLSYLADRFDWTANYVATLSTDAATMDIGAWVTLANGNSISFPSAHAQVVAGRLNREIDQDKTSAPSEAESRILAQCWPRGTTSDALVDVHVVASRRALQAAAPAAILMETVATAPRSAQLVQEEQLGDLKLYRVPEPTSILGRQIKQVRLLDRSRVPVQVYYAADVWAGTVSFFEAQRKVRTKNDVQHHLGLPLPSGRIDTFATRRDTPLLISENAMHDTAIGEDVEFGLGESADVQVRATDDVTSIAAHPLSKVPPELRGVRRSESAIIDHVSSIEISNARSSPIAFELRLQLQEGMQLIASDPAPASTAGKPLYKLTIPAEGSTTIRYQTEHAALHSVR